MKSFSVYNLFSLLVGSGLAFDGDLTLYTVFCIQGRKTEPALKKRFADVYGKRELKAFRIPRCEKGRQMKNESDVKCKYECAFYRENSSIGDVKRKEAGGRDRE